ncbi:MAG: YihY/virulence factor BrkB family protein [Labilithrix sp.]|nr:YihY/virulence factor BrkB family protein [Labilithrix sp.]
MTTRWREHVRNRVELFAKTGERWGEIEGFRLAAAFSFYATFAIFPLVLLTVTVVGFIVGEGGATQDRIAGVAAGAPSTRALIDQTLTAMQEHRAARGTSAFVAVATLLFSASGAFVELDHTLNAIWRVPPRQGGGFADSVLKYVEERLSGFALVGLVGLTLLASLVISFVLGWIAAHAETKLTPALLQTAELAVSIALLSGVFTMVFHLVPRSRPPLRDVFGGAVLTTAMLTILKSIFVLYLTKLTSYSAYGVVGGVLALATWIYLSSLVVFLGATLTRVSCELRECRAARRDDGVSASPRAKEGPRASADLPVVEDGARELESRP